MHKLGDMLHSVFAAILEQIKVGKKSTAFDFTEYDYSNEPDRQQKNLSSIQYWLIIQRLIIHKKYIRSK